MSILSAVRSQLNQPRYVVGLEAIALPAGQTVINVCALRRRGDTVTVELQKTGLASWADLAALPLEKEACVALVLNGRGVLHKSLSAGLVPPSDVGALVATLLPGAAATEFRLQSVASPATEHVSLVRSEYLADVLKALQEQGLRVVDASLGPFRFATLLPFVDAAFSNSVVTLGDARVAIETGKIVRLEPVVGEIPPEPATILVDREPLSPPMVLPYAAALAVLLDQAVNGLHENAIRHNKEEWRQKQIFKWAGTSVLVLFFLSLFANFLLFIHLNERQKNLTSDAAANRQALNRLTQLRQAISRQDDFLTHAGWVVPTSHSIWADQLAASVPPGMRLITIDVFPLNQHHSTVERQPIFAKGTVLVKGECREAHVLNQWLARVSRLRWVKAVREQDFSFDYSTGTGSFTCAIQAQ